MDDFQEATVLQALGDNQWEITLTKDWALWGPAGGYLAALALRAAKDSTEFTRPVSLSCHFLRVAKFEAIQLDVESLRRGKRSEVLRVNLVQDDKLILTAMVWVTDADQETMVHDYATVNNIPAPDSLKSYQEVYPNRSVHPFMRRMEHRPIDPVTDGDLTPREPENAGLYRFFPKPMADDYFIDACRATILIDTFAWLATYPAHPIA
ncbi:MAG: acyl-CoA thioesterase domain-containing protein, partial [Pseudomonadota bacterium]